MRCATLVMRQHDRASRAGASPEALHDWRKRIKYLRYHCRLLKPAWRGEFEARDALAGGSLVATVMSNLGLERSLGGLGLTLERTKVGDRYVLERMKQGGFNVGGEQSGHMILLDHATTGDGTVAALRVLASLVRSGKPASEILHNFDPVPQLLKNVRYEGTSPLDNETVKSVIADAEGELTGKGRLVIRASGTEPLIRVMAEGDDASQVESVVDRVCDAVRGAA